MNDNLNVVLCAWIASIAGRFARSRDGVTALEYALIAALIAIVIVFGIGRIGAEIAAGCAAIAYYL
jgi:Flp pilus assembly pilin Flp